MGAYLVWTPAGGGNGQSLQFDLVESEVWDTDTTVTEHPVEVGADVADNVRVLVAKCQLEIFATNEPLGRNNWTQASLQTTTLPAPGMNQTAPTGQPLTAHQWNNQIGLRTLLIGAGGVVGGSAFGATGAFAGAGLGAVAGVGLALPGPVDERIPAPPGLNPSSPAATSFQSFLFTETDDYVAKMIDQLAALKDAAQLIQVVGSKQSRDNMVIETLQVTRDKDTGSGASISLGLREIRFVQTQVVAAPKPTIVRGNTTTSKGTQNPKDPPANGSILKGLANTISKIYATLGGPPASAGVE